MRMSTNSKLMTALSGVVNNVYPLAKPTTEDPSEYIVFNPEADYLDYGDDIDQSEDRSWQVHWFKRGIANSVSVRRQIRDALRAAGFVLMPNTYEAYENDTGVTTKTPTGWTHLVITCRIEED